MKVQTHVGWSLSLLFVFIVQHWSLLFEFVYIVVGFNILFCGVSCQVVYVAMAPPLVVPKYFKHKFLFHCIHVNPFNVEDFSQYPLHIIVVFDLAQKKIDLAIKGRYINLITILKINE